MTFEELSNYRYIANLIERFRIEYVPSYLSAVDTSKPAVQTSNISNATADIAINRMCMDDNIVREYNRLTEIKKRLDAYIYSIKDDLVKAIAIRHFVFGDTLEAISKELHYSRPQVSRKLHDYINTHETND